MKTPVNITIYLGLILSVLLFSPDNALSLSVFNNTESNSGTCIKAGFQDNTPGDSAFGESKLPDFNGEGTVSQWDKAAEFMAKEAAAGISGLLSGKSIATNAAPEIMKKVPVGITVRLHYAGFRPFRATATAPSAVKAYVRALSSLVKKNYITLNSLQNTIPEASITVYFSKSCLSRDESSINRLLREGKKAIVIEGNSGNIFLAPVDYLPRELTGKEILKKAGRRELYSLTQSTWATGEKGNFIFELEGTLAPREELSPSVLRRAAIGAGSYLVRGQKSDGSFDYEYNPWKDHSSSKYNIVRHSGVTWAILRLYKHTGQSYFLKAGLSGTNYILDNIRWRRTHPMAFVTPESKSVLGATALSVLALMELPVEYRTKKIRKAAKCLGKGLVYLLSSKGAFYRTLNDRKTRTIEKKTMLFFPGESLLALSTLWSEFGVPWKKPALLAAEYQAALYRNRGVTCHWSVQGLSLAGRLDKNRSLLSAAFDMGTTLTKGQYGKETGSRAGGWPGAANQEPAACAAACRLEALGPAITAGRRLGEPVDTLEERLLAGAGFIISQQITKDNGFFLPWPDRAHGGIRKYPGNLTVRMDVNQHCIAALLNALELLEMSPHLAAAISSP